MKFYNTRQIDKLNADYNIIIGERSNGKSYALKVKALENYKKDRSKTLWIRRYQTEILPKNTQSMFTGLSENGEFNRIFGDEWDDVIYKKHAFYLTKFDYTKNKWIDCVEPFMYLVSVADSEHERDRDIPDITTVVYDEFITRGNYLYNEFTRYCNILSTYIRNKDGVKIYMLGNTVSKNCPYFEEMGLHRIYKQNKGTIDIYTLNEEINEEIHELKIAVEITANTISKKSDKYFAFNNPSLKMITNGDWELQIYNHCPYKLSDNELCDIFCVKIQNDVIQGDCYTGVNGRFIYIHPKTSLIHPNTLTYSKDTYNGYYTSHDLFTPLSPLQRAIHKCYIEDRIFYSDNTVGEKFNDFIKECKLK